MTEERRRKDPSGHLGIRSVRVGLIDENDKNSALLVIPVISPYYNLEVPLELNHGPVRKKGLRGPTLVCFANLAKRTSCNNEHI